MYYYITEAPPSKEFSRALDEVRTTLSSMGIAGEFVTASPARTIEELAEIGVAKRYTTIVAVGSQSLINKVATLLAGTPYVLGAIPLEQLETLAPITGTNTLKETAEALKYRRIKEVPITRIEPNKFFFTTVSIPFSNPTNIELTIDDALIETKVSHVEISGDGRVLLKALVEPPQGVESVIRRWFGKERPPKTEISQFKGSSIGLDTKNSHSVYIGRSVFAKTPLAATVIPSCLKLIVKRDRLLASQSEIQVAGGSHTPEKIG